MIANILIYEDNKHTSFYPLSYLRPVYDLVSGMSTLLSKISRDFPEANISLHCRESLKDIVKQNHPGIAVNNVNAGLGCLVINGRLLLNGSLKDKLKLDDKDRVFLDEYDEVAAAYLNSENLHILKNKINNIFSSKDIISTFRNKCEISQADCRLIEYPWELVNENIEQLTRDFNELIPNGIIKGEIHPQTVILDEYKVYVGEKTRIFSNVTINAEKGPVYIGENCTIKPHTYIEGPAYIGNNSKIIGAILLPGTSIGANCKVSGTIKNSIFRGFSKVENINFQDSYCADAVEIANHTSNDSRSFQLNDEPDIYIDGYEIKTGEKNLGAYIADYARIGAINNFKSGSVVGLATTVHSGNNNLPKYIPSFLVQEGDTDFNEISFANSLELIEYYLKQKDIELTPVEKDLIEYVYYKSADRKVNKIIF